VTAAGVSAGIDMALELVALTRGDEMARMIQLVIEYDPQPPFDSGSRSKATAQRIADAQRRIAEIYAPQG
jgi:transcriptional regulator GlxA family with amidase domain